MKLNIMNSGFVAFYCQGCGFAHILNVSDSNDGPLWDFDGNNESPTFSPSVLVKHTHPKGHTNTNPAPADYNGEMVTDICHSFVKEGRIEYLNDCTHELAGKTLDMVDFKWS